VLCCAVLCCAVLCCAVLCCAVLCCAVLCCAVLCCAVLCCAVCFAERLYEAVTMSGDTLLAVVQSMGESEVSTPRSLMALNLRTGNSSMKPLVSMQPVLGCLLNKSM
jgi:hypothetical protein